MCPYVKTYYVDYVSKKTYEVYGTFTKKRAYQSPHLWQFSANYPCH
jgi:hypothetical protein